MRCYRPSHLPDPGQITGQVYWNPKDPTHVALVDKVENPVISSYQITWSDGTTAVADGFVQNANIGNMVVDGNVTMDFTIKLTGLVTITPGP
jgi:hypothetical protein